MEILREIILSILRFLYIVLLGIGYLIGGIIFLCVAFTAIAPVIAMVMLIGKKIWQFVHPPSEPLT